MSFAVITFFRAASGFDFDEGVLLSSPSHIARWTSLS